MRALTFIIFENEDYEQLITYAEQEFSLGSSSDPKSKRSQLLSVERQTGKLPDELVDLVELPESATFIWRWFIDLNNARQSGMSINPISYSEIAAYFSLYNIHPYEYEIQMIKILDNIALKHYTKQQEAETKKIKKK